MNGICQCHYLRASVLLRVGAYECIHFCVYTSVYIYTFSNKNLEKTRRWQKTGSRKNQVFDDLEIWEVWMVLMILIRSVFQILQWFPMWSYLFMCPPAAPRRPKWFMLATSGNQFFLIHPPGSQVRLEWLNRIGRNHLMYPASLKWLCAASRDRCSVRFTASRQETRRLIRDGFPMKSSNSCVDHTRGLMQNPANVTWSTIKKNTSCSLWRLGMKGNNALPSW